LRTGRSSRLSLIIISMVIAVGLLVGSQLGILGPLQGLIATPIGVIAGVFNRIGFAINGNLDQVNDLEVARQRIAELEDRLAQFQSELVELREVASDYDRLSRLLNYESSRQNEDYLTANVIASDDPNTLLRTIMIDRGSRDGVTRGMAVVTDQGMLGRVLRVAAGASQVLLITDPSSAISARLQTSRTQAPDQPHARECRRRSVRQSHNDIHPADRPGECWRSGDDLWVGRQSTERHGTRTSDQRPTVRI